MNLLVVCTANRCRSPIGEVLLRAAMQERKREANISSAGLLQSGIPATDEAIACVAEVGLDLTSHLSRQINPTTIKDADLILTMERMHVREIAVMNPEALAKTFTLREFLRLAADEWPIGMSIADRIGELGSGRKPSNVLKAPRSDDIDDPFQHPLAAFRATRDELTTAMNHVADLLTVADKDPALPPPGAAASAP